METYRSDTEGQPDITLDGTKEDYEKLRKQYPHLSIEECEYSCAGAEFYMKLLKHQEVCRHQVILYRRENGAYVLHRVMENSDHNSYVLCGDNQYRKEYGVQPEQILAALTGFYRGNQYIDCEKNKKYKQYVKLWCSPLFPRRCAVWAVKAVMKIRSRASKR